MESMDFFAGSLGGAAGVLVGHPFDTVKVRLQTQTPMSNIQYKGTIDCFRKIIHNETFLGLYKGISSPLCGLAIINAVVFGIYGNALRQTDDPSDVRNQMMAGACAGFAQAWISSPMELVKLRIQLQGQGIPHHIYIHMPEEGPYNSPAHCVQRVYKDFGIRGLYRGVSLTVLRDVTGFALYFGVYESLTRYWQEYRNTDGLNAAELLMAGGLSGSISWLLNYPIDVIKSRYTSRNPPRPDRPVSRHPQWGQHYTSIRQCISDSYRTYGLRVFYQGLTPTLLRAFPTNAVTFLAVAVVYRCYRWWSGRVDLMKRGDDEKINSHLRKFMEPDVIYYGFPYWA